MTHRTAKHFWSDESGASAIELGVVSALILVPLLLGGTELGRRIWARAQLDNAARVGINYVMANHQASPTGTAIQNAVQSATYLGTAVTLTAMSGCGSAYYCYGCPTSSGVTLSGTSTTCGAGGSSGKYAAMTASYSYTPLFQGCGHLLPSAVCPLTSAPITLSTQVVTRIQ
jgi:Flp pilus assembly protein TadG